MKIAEIMSTPVVTVELDDSLQVVKEIFDSTGFHHLLVVASNKLFGVLSDRDLLRALSPNIGTLSETPNDAATLNKRVHQVMTRKPIAIEPTASVQAAVDIFNEHRISCVPVIDEDEKPVGIVSWRDVLRVASV